jgi:hypothetical protein
MDEIEGELEAAGGGEEDLDLSAMPDEAITAEGFTSHGGEMFLTEDQDIFEDADLPTPEEANSDIDFTENN